MAFTEGIRTDVLGTQAGEVVGSNPHAVDSFDVFEDNLVIGRIVKLDAGSIDNLDGSATPTLAGVAKRKVNKALEQTAYRTLASGTVPADSVADVVTFGRVAVTIDDAAVPTVGAAVYAINAAGANAGKVTQNATGTLAVTGAKFVKEVADKTWIITLPSYQI